MLRFHQIAPVHAPAATDSADCSFADIQQLQKSITHCLGNGDHCADCRRITSYMRDLWAQPHLVRLSWFGSSRFNPRVLDQLLQVLGAFVKQIRDAKLPEDDSHQQFVAVVTDFCHQHGYAM